MPAPGRRNRRGASNSGLSLASVARETATSLAGDSPVLAIFKDAAVQLTARQDKHERLVKMSRDITIESKRIIFLLHSAVTTDASRDTLTEASERIQKLINESIKGIALEVENSPAHLHSKAVTVGLQEFVEARTYLSLMTEKRIITYAEIQKEFEFIITEDDQQRTIVTLLPEFDYMLGLADLTGELMRKAINSISSGDREQCFQAGEVIRLLYAGFLGLTIGNRNLIRKLPTTRANVKKVEMAMYALQIRGGEAPPMLVIPTAPEWEDQPGPKHPDDEGYYQECV